MTEKTQQIFNAPWMMEGNSKDLFIAIYDSKGICVSRHIQDLKNARRTLCIPEVYESFLDLQYEHCRSCLYESRTTDQIPSADEFVSRGCPKCPVDSIISCRRNRGWMLLRRMRDGK